MRTFQEGFAGFRRFQSPSADPRHLLQYVTGGERPFAAAKCLCHTRLASPSPHADITPKMRKSLFYNGSAGSVPQISLSPWEVRVLSVQRN